MRKLKIFVLTVAILITCLTFSDCVKQTINDANNVTKYTMYIGLNDKDTYTQTITYEEAEKR